MATLTFRANGRKERLTISTVLNHWIIFHEAGFEFTTEKKRLRSFVWWNPATWGGYEWMKSDRAEQPAINDFIFIQGRDIERNPSDFNVASTRSTGYFKLSCIQVEIGMGGNTDGSGIGPKPDVVSDLGNDAASVRNVKIEFTYNQRRHTLFHSYD